MTNVIIGYFTGFPGAATYGFWFLFAVVAFNMYLIYGSVLMELRTVVTRGGHVISEDSSQNITSWRSMVVTWCYFFLLGQAVKGQWEWPEWGQLTAYYVTYVTLVTLYAVASTARFMRKLFIASAIISAIIFITEYIVLAFALSSGAMNVTKDVIEDVFHLHGYAPGKTDICSFSSPRCSKPCAHRNMLSDAPHPPPPPLRPDLRGWVMQLSSGIRLASSLPARVFNGNLTLFGTFFTVLAHALLWVMTSLVFYKLFLLIPRPTVRFHGGFFSGLVWPFAVMTISALTIFATSVPPPEGTPMLKVDNYWDLATAVFLPKADANFGSGPLLPGLLDGALETNVSSLIQLTSYFVAAPMAYTYIVDGNKALFGKWSQDGMLNTVLSAFVAVSLLNTVISKEREVVAATAVFAPAAAPLLTAAITVGKQVVADAGFVLLAVILAQNARVLAGTAVENTAINSAVGWLMMFDGLVALFVCIAILAGYISGSSVPNGPASNDYLMGTMAAVGGAMQILVMVAPIVLLAWGANAFFKYLSGDGTKRKTKVA